MTMKRALYDLFPQPSRREFDYVSWRTAKRRRIRRARWVFAAEILTCAAVGALLAFFLAWRLGLL
jgi:hypothetical protein